MIARTDDLLAALKELQAATETMFAAIRHDLAGAGSPYPARLLNAISAVREALGDGLVARPRDEYHEDMGPVLWWFFPISEAPYIGTDNDVEDYHTHWTPLGLPPAPPAPDGHGRTEG